MGNLVNFIRYDENKAIIKRIIITSRPACIYENQDSGTIQAQFRLHTNSTQKDNLVLTIAPFTKDKCKELVKNLLTLWSVNRNIEKHELADKIKKVQTYALQFSESPILIRIICQLSLDPSFDGKNMSILNIYHNICEKLVDRYFDRSNNRTIPD